MMQGRQALLDANTTRYRLSRPAHDAQGARWDYWRPAKCDEVACPAYLTGWVTTVPDSSDHAAFIRRDLRFTYSFTEEPPDAAGLVQFIFPAGQPCFQASQHRLPLERNPMLIRGQQQLEVNHWLDEFQTSLDAVR